MKYSLLEPQTQTLELLEKIFLRISKEVKKELIEKYEVKKTDFTNNLNKDIEEKFSAQENGKDKNVHNEKESKIEIIERLKDSKKSWESIGEVFGASADSIRMWYKRNKTNELNT